MWKIVRYLQVRIPLTNELKILEDLTLFTFLHCFAVSKLEWDSPLDIVRYPDPRLRAKNAKIAVFDESVKQLAAEMFEIMYRYRLLMFLDSMLSLCCTLHLINWCNRRLS